MGKSSVLALFGKLGAFVLDSDQIVRVLLEDPAVVNTVTRLSGQSVLAEDGSLNREKLAEIVFRDDLLRHSLEDVLHPLVFEKMDNLLAAAETENTISVVEVPLLFERGYENRFDRTVTVFTDEETAIRRLEAKGIAYEQASLRLKTQLPIEEKKKRADFLIDNSGTPQETEEQVKTVYIKLVEEADDGNHTRTRKSR